MTTLKALIVDDEEYSRKSLYFLIQENCPEVQVAGIVKSVSEARQLISAQVFNLVFLDIAMPKENGFELLPALQERNIRVIFTTAYDQYALKALKANAIDYLLKPIDIEELKTAVSKAEAWANLTSPRTPESLSSRESDESSQPTSSASRTQKKITLPNTYGFNVIDTADIIYVEADSNYSEFHLQDGEKLVISKPLKEIEDSLDPQEFLRIHKSVIVNFRYIKSYVNKNGWQIILSNGVTLPVSRRRATEFQEKAKNYFNK
ncbi:LytTR family DNA-binding domain-containing protein [Pedobacter sp. SYSU D00535]|uniref:LytR/AlgR family response regulator transcription factor n=1 Tax=Pedobacter sp. SYSU D00535 TaxID=2810308 RepID=UPI001A95C138|nr:LytTR family DNA-binding domain-containing protein [Pedobacter sp. SYSU D00535]